MNTFTGLSAANGATKLDVLFGVTLEMQRRIGTFIVVWGMFELSCEPLVWALYNEDPTGKHPSTDRKPISDLLSLLDTWVEKNTTHDFVEQVSLLYATAQDLVAYRNAIIHGRVFAGPAFMSNVPIWGELRKRPAATAHINEQLLEMAAEASDTLFKCGSLIAASIRKSLPNTENFFGTMTAKLKHAQSMAHELRYIAQMIQNEKY